MPKWACFHAISLFSLCNECKPQAVIAPEDTHCFRTAFAKFRDRRIRLFNLFLLNFHIDIQKQQELLAVEIKEIVF